VNPRGNGVVVVFAKAPRPGFVKTRMVPPLTPAEASDLYARMLDDVLASTARAARDLGLSALACVHPRSACGEIARAVPSHFRVVGQRGNDLQQRMTWAVREAAALGASRILLRGSDSPALEPASIARALAALETWDVVLCPDRDGGYTLVGMRQPTPGLFDHPMSTRSVLDDPLANARELGLRTHVEPPGFDLDTVEDIRLLARSRSDSLSRLCPATLRYLDENDLWRRAGCDQVDCID
jgi:rSAM/selenodomain-associated transferase 1